MTVIGSLDVVKCYVSENHVLVNNHLGWGYGMTTNQPRINLACYTTVNLNFNKNNIKLSLFSFYVLCSIVLQIENLKGKLTKKATENIPQPTQPVGGKWFFCCCCLFVCLFRCLESINKCVW